MQMTIFPSVTNTQGRIMDFPDCQSLFDCLLTPHPLRFSIAEIKANSKLKDVGGFVGGTFNNCKRAKNELTSRTAITLDLDESQLNVTQIEELLTSAFKSYAFCIYSTAKHTSQDPHLRVVFPLSQPIVGTSREIDATTAKVTHAICAQVPALAFDPASAVSAQMFFFHSTASDGESYTYASRGAKLIYPTEWALLAPEQQPDTTHRKQSPAKDTDTDTDGVQRTAPNAFVRSVEDTFNYIYSTPDKLLVNPHFSQYVTSGTNDRRLTEIGKEPNGIAIEAGGYVCYNANGRAGECVGRLLTPYEITAVMTCAGSLKQAKSQFAFVAVGEQIRSLHMIENERSDRESTSFDECQGVWEQIVESALTFNLAGHPSNSVRLLYKSVSANVSAKPSARKLLAENLAGGEWYGNGKWIDKARANVIAESNDYPDINNFRAVGYDFSATELQYLRTFVVQALAPKNTAPTANICLYIYGKQGTGKNTFAEALATALNGERAIFSDYATEMGFARFSSPNSTKQLVTILDECTPADSKKSYGTFKAVITSNLCKVEKKFQSPIVVQARRNYIFLSNTHPAEFIRDESERRILPIEMRVNEWRTTDGTNVRDVVLTACRSFIKGVLKCIDIEDPQTCENFARNALRNRDVISGASIDVWLDYADVLRDHPNPKNWVRAGAVTAYLATFRKDVVSSDVRKWFDTMGLPRGSRYKVETLQNIAREWARKYGSDDEADDEADDNICPF